MSIKGFSIGGVTQRYDYNALDNIPKGGGLSEEAKQAILQIAEKVAYIDANGQTYYNVLHDAFYPPKTVVLLTAVFEQGSTVIYDDTALNDLKQYLTVTAKYDDNTTAILADSAYTLSGLLEAPSSTVTVLYNGVSTTFTVAVTARPTLSSISAVYTQSGTVYDTDTLDSLKDDLVVTAIYTDSSTEVIADEDYTLSGTLTVGTSTITVSYGGKTDTFDVTVVDFPRVIDNGQKTFADGTTLTVFNNHVTILLGNADGNKFMNLSTLANNTSDPLSTSNVNNQSITYMSFSTGNTVAISLTNGQADNTTWVNTSTKAYTIATNLRSGTSSIATAATISPVANPEYETVTDNTGNHNFNSNATASCLFCFVGACFPQGTTIEFDVNVVKGV